MVSIDGLASGLDTSGLIEQILQLQRRPIALVQQQIQQAQQKQTAFLDLTARLLSLQTSAEKLSSPEAFQGVRVSSSNESVLAASASAGVPPGVYAYRVAQLASPGQFASSGFASLDTAVGAGTLSLEFGGFIDVDTNLSELNGGEGVSRGAFRITDRSGSSAEVDLSAAVTVQDVIDAINETDGIDVRARVAGIGDATPGRSIVLEDQSGGAGNFVVEDVDGLDVASDLGLVASVASSTIEGSNIRNIGESTRLSSLNDGLGVRLGAGADFVIATENATLAVDLNGLTTVGDLLDAVNSHVDNGGNVTMSVNAGGDGFVLTDNTGTTGITVTDGALATAATDLGLIGTTAGATLSGTGVLSAIDDLYLSTLNGGSGVAAGGITITDRAGTAVNVDLSGATSVQDVVRLINDSGSNVTASFNSEGNGFLLRDSSGGTGTLTVAENGSTTAEDLGILGTGTGNRLNGVDTNPRYIHKNARLSELNGGAGVAAGSIQITATNGTVFTVNLNQEETIGAVISDINGRASTVGLSGQFVASLNDAGNGILITDTSGAGTLRISEVDGGTTARDLHLLGTSDTGIIDGSFEERVEIGASDTLEDVQEKIAELGFAATATILNDGSSNPYRLNIVGGVSGSRARLLVDTSGGTNLSFTRTAEAQDGILFFGESTSSSDSILIRNDSNTYDDIVEGLTVTAFQTSEAPVRITVSEDREALGEEVEDFVNRFNIVLQTIRSFTEFDLETETRGVLLGDGTVRTVKNQIFNGAIRPIAGVDNAFSVLSEIGIRVQNGALSFSRAEFDDALDEDPDAVRRLFSANRTLNDRTLLEDFNNGNGVDVDTAGDDFEVFLRDGTSFNVDISGSTTVEDVIDAINDAATTAGLSLTAEIAGNGRSLVLRDGTTGPETLRVAARNGSSAANDLGLNGVPDAEGGGVMTGYEIDLSDDPGIASRLVDVIENLTDADEGALQRRADSFDAIISDLEDRIDRLNERVLARETLLRRQFAQLEQVIQQSQATQQRLQAQLSSLG